MVQGWYQGGVSVFDFTDSANPVEIAYFDRGPIDAKNLITGGYWSAYWYNGNIYGAEIARGIDVFRLTPSEFLSENELAAANLVRFEEFNSQQQPQGHLAAELRRGQGVPRPDGARQDDRRRRAPRRWRPRSIAATPAPGAARASLDRTRRRWPPSSRPTRRRLARATRTRMRAMAATIKARTARLR